MTLTVIEGGRRPMPSENARASVIEAAASAMAHERGRTWSRMTEARKDQYRAQVRACIRALRPDWQMNSAWIALGARSVVHHDSLIITECVDAWLAELLE